MWIFDDLKIIQIENSQKHSSPALFAISICLVSIWSNRLSALCYFMHIEKLRSKGCQFFEYPINEHHRARLPLTTLCICFYDIEAFLSHECCKYTHTITKREIRTASNAKNPITTFRCTSINSIFQSTQSFDIKTTCSRNLTNNNNCSEWVSNNYNAFENVRMRWLWCKMP